MPNRKPGAPEGNRNAAHDKPWADALRKAVLQYEDKEAGIGRGDALRMLAVSVIKRGLNGADAAIREFGDRMDGKPRQQIEAENSNSNYMYVISDRPMTTAEWEKKYCSSNAARQTGDGQ